MATPRIAVYSIPALLIAIIVAAGSLALVDSAGIDTNTQAQLQPPVDLGPLAESITVTGVPIVFSEDTEPTTDAKGDGLLITSKQRAIANFLGDVGTPVEVRLHIDNFNDDTENLLLVNISAPDTLVVDVIEDSGTHEVRLVGHNQFVMQVDRGTGHSFIIRVTYLVEGVHDFIAELKTIG